MPKTNFMLIVSVAVFLIVSCAPAATTPAPSATTNTGAVQPATPAAAQPKPGGKLTIKPWTGGDISGLDPYLNSNNRTDTYASFFFSRLLKSNSGPEFKPNSFSPTGDLAEKWEISKDGLTYTFSLRKNAKWHNKPPLNGRALTADDVLFSWNRYKEVTPPGVKGSPLVQQVKEVKKVDESTIAFVLKDVYAPWETALVSSNFYIVPKEVIDADGDLSKRPLGSGPFIFEKYEKGVVITGKKNPDYFLSGKPYLDEVEILIIPEDSTALAGMRAKTLDFNYLNNQTDRNGLAKTNPEIQIVDYSFLLVPIFWWKLDAKPFDDIRVRRAVSMAMDRDETINNIFEGRGGYNNFVTIGLDFWWLDPRSAEMGESAKYFKRNIPEAKKLLGEAGYPNGMKVPFITTLNAYGDTFNGSVEQFMKNLKEVGIETELRAQDFAAFVSSTFVGKFDGGSIVYGLSSGADPNDFLFNWYHPKGPRNLAGVNDPVLTEMIEKQSRITDRNERRKLVFDIQKYLGDKQYYVSNAVGNRAASFQPWVKNLHVLNSGYVGAEWVINVWLDGKPKN